MLARYSVSSAQSLLPPDDAMLKVASFGREESLICRTLESDVLTDTLVE